MTDCQFNLTEVMQVTKAVLKGVTITSTFCGVSTDTRTINPGMLFVALNGENFNGHDFVEAAAAKGAAGAIISNTEDINRFADLDISILTVDDTLIAYQELAKLWRSKFDIPVIAITGSNGKTTTKDLTAAVLAGKYKVLKTEANFNNEIGLPLTLLKLNSTYDVAVVEMGMRGLGQIKALTEIAHPTMGVVTNVGETHLELLGSIENIARAKAELAEAIELDGIVVLNADDAQVKAMATRTKAKVIYFGVDHAADIKAFDIVTLSSGITAFEAIVGNTTAHFELPILGLHNVYNCLAALAVGYACGLSVAEMQRGLAEFKPTAMRFEYKRIGNLNIINDAYNASPMSTKAALINLAKVASKRKILVMGDMFELGAIAETAHGEIGTLAGEYGIDVVLTRGELTAYTATKARAANVPQVYECASHEVAVAKLKALVQPEDTILFKGSHGMHMEKIIEMLENEYTC